MRAPEKNVCHLVLSKFKLKTGRKLLVLRRYGFSNSLPMGIKKVESNQPSPYCLIWDSVSL